MEHGENGGRGNLNSFSIEDIINDKIKFWQYILGTPCSMCKALNTEKTNSKSIDEINSPVSVEEERKRKIAALRAKANNINKIDTPKLECIKSKCALEDYVKKEALEEKYSKTIDLLKKNIELWKKKQYNISGYIENEDFFIKFEKIDNTTYKSQKAIRKDVITYCNTTEEINGYTYYNDVRYDKIIGATELVLLSEWIKIVNDDVRNFCKIQYKIGDSIG